MEIKYFHEKEKKANNRKMFVDDEAAVQRILSLHSHKIRHDPTTRCAFLLFMDENRCVPLTSSFVKFSRADLVDAPQLDKGKRSIQWLLHQVSTYDHEVQVLAGVVFPTGDALALVFPSTTRTVGKARNVCE